MAIRRAVAADRDALYDICARTADGGNDARALHHLPELLGEIWVGPYLALLPDLAFVADDDDGVSGYVVGAADTESFDAACEQHWWPPLRACHPLPPAEPATPADIRLIGWIHDPPATPASVVEQFPAHLHINLLPRAQGHGAGRRLVSTLCAALVDEGATGVHLGVGVGNTRAIGFYTHVGFRPIGPPSADATGLFLGLHLAPGQEP